MELENLKTELKERVAKGLNFGIEAVDDVINSDSELYNKFVLLESKYNDLMYVSSINTLSYEQLEIGLDRLRSGLLSLIDSLEDGHMEKQEVKKELSVSALPTRRSNFFMLLDIHFRNLQSIQYVVVFSGSGNNPKEEYRRSGREAIFEYYKSRRQLIAQELRNKPELNPEETVKKVFLEFFERESGTYEVYLKNIKHLMRYVLNMEVERNYFIDTLKSLFSRYELVMLFYYAFCNITPDLTELLKKSAMIDSSIESILIDPEHLTFLAT